MIDLLISVAIMSTLLGLLLVAIDAVRESSRTLMCANNLRQICIAANAFEGSQRSLPAGKMEVRIPQTASNPWGWGYIVPLLPYLDADSALQDVQVTPSYCPTILLSLHRKGRPSPTSVRLPFLSCPSDENSGRPIVVLRGTDIPNPRSVEMGLVHPGNYLGVSGTDFIEGNCMSSIEVLNGNGVLFSDRRVRLSEIKDGMSKTLLIGERGVPKSLLYGWMMCATGRCDPYLSTALGLSSRSGSHYKDNAQRDRINRRFWSFHSSGTTFGFVDGSVRELEYEIDGTVLNSLATRSGDANMGSGYSPDKF